jgi:hypothetical protein
LLAVDAWSLVLGFVGDYRTANAKYAIMVPPPEETFTIDNI